MALHGLGRYEPDRVDRVGDRALVLGGSVAGLCAARVLADGFDEVVVLERDPLPDEPVVRDGAPQTDHPHILLEAGREALDALFPGFSDDLSAAGGLCVDAATEMTYYAHGGTLADGPAPLEMYCASRALFEHVLRRHVRALDGVWLRENHAVTDYRDDGSERITGVACRREDDTEATIDADLVVDATGRTSRTPAWLDANGYESPPVEDVRVDIRYSTIRVERPPDDRRVLTTPPTAPRTRGGAAIPVEGGQWEVTMQGIHGDDPPTDRDEFVEFARSLPFSALADVVTDRSWVSESVDAYPFPASKRRRYEALDRFPDGLVVTGDAVASFNPIYGQGMSVAAVEALALHRRLADGGRSALDSRHRAEVGELVDDVWRLAVGADFTFDRTTGPKPRGTDLFNWYIERLLRRAQDDGALSDAFYRVFRLEAPPTSLLQPGVLWRVFRPRRG